MQGAQNARKVRHGFVLHTEEVDDAPFQDVTKVPAINIFVQHMGVENGASLMIATSRPWVARNCVPPMVAASVVLWTGAKNPPNLLQSSASSTVGVRSVLRTAVKKWLVVGPNTVLPMVVESDANWQGVTVSPLAKSNCAEPMAEVRGFARARVAT